MFLFFNKQILDIKRGGYKILIFKIKLFLEFLINLPIYFICFICIIFLRIISPILTMRLGKLPCSNFGDFLMMPSLYYCKKKLNFEQPKNNFLDIIYIYEPKNFYNKYLEKMWSKKFKIYKSYILHKIYQINNILPNSKKFNISIFSNEMENDVDNLIDQYQPLTFDEDEIKKGTQELKKLGINFSSDKFVCLAVRDQAFTKIKLKDVNFSYENYEYRNDNIYDFLEGADELTKKGYFVLRVGKINEIKLKSKNKMIIDYANSEIKSDFMDLFIGGNCHFCISSGYGFDYLPYIFRKMIGVLEFPLGMARTFSDRIIILPRKYHSISKKKDMSLSDIFREKIEFEGNSRFLKDKNIVVKKFTSSEIKNFILEVEKYSNDKNYLNNIYSSKSQKKFRTKFKNLFNKERYFFAMHKPLKKIHGKKIRSVISDSFLKNNNNWLN